MRNVPCKLTSQGSPKCRYIPITSMVGPPSTESREKAGRKIRKKKSGKSRGKNQEKSWEESREKIWEESPGKSREESRGKSRKKLKNCREKKSRKKSGKKSRKKSGKKKGLNERVAYLRKEIINSVTSVYKLLLFHVAKRASGERSSSPARRLNTLFPRIFKLSISLY